MSVRVPRKGSKWRKSAFDFLCSKDGAVCQKCNAPHRTIWREAGIFVTGFGGDRYTRVNPSSVLEVDHKVPLSEGGTNDFENLWLLCRDCHKQKTSSERSNRLKALFADWRTQQVQA